MPHATAIGRWRLFAMNRVGALTRWQRERSVHLGAKCSRKDESTDLFMDGPLGIARHRRAGEDIDDAVANFGVRGFRLGQDVQIRHQRAGDPPVR